MQDLNPVITRYLTGQMSAAERQAFEARMAADPELAAEVVFYETLQHQHDQDLKKEWHALGQDLLDTAGPAAEIPASPLRVTHRRLNFRWAAAATLALALSAAGFWWYHSLPTRGEKIYAEQYTALDESGGTLGTPNPQDAWTKAYRSYRAKHYEQARREAAPLLSQENEADRARLLIGLCWLESGHTTEARQALSQVRPTAVAYYWTARFGLAFAYLRDNDLEQANAVLRDISQNADTPEARKKAEELLSK